MPSKGVTCTFPLLIIFLYALLKNIYPGRLNVGVHQGTWGRLSQYTLGVTISCHVRMVSVNASVDMLWVRDICSNASTNVLWFCAKEGMMSSEHHMMTWWHKWLCITSLGYYVLLYHECGWCQKKEGITRDECKDLGFFGLFWALF